MNEMSLLALLWGGVVLAAGLRLRPARRLPSTGSRKPRIRAKVVVDRLALAAGRAGMHAADLFGFSFILTNDQLVAIGRGVIFAPLLTLLLPLWSLPIGMVMPLIMQKWSRHRTCQDVERRMRSELPEVCDLLRLAIGSGMTVPLAIDAVARHGCGEIAGVLRSCRRLVSNGLDFDQAITASLGSSPVLRVLGGLLVQSLESGVAVERTLGQLSEMTRHELSRQTDERVNRLPVLLLFPLVFCILPSFVLLSVVPLIAGGFRALSL